MSKVSKYSSRLGVKPSNNVIDDIISHEKSEKEEIVLFKKNYEKSIWPHEIPYQIEPRPDLKDDTKLWQLILHNAFQLEPDAWNVLHGIRCLGARADGEIKGKNRTIKITRGEIPEGEWLEIKTMWLTEQKENIRSVFSVTEELGRVETKVFSSAPWWVQIEVVELDGRVRIVGPGTAEATQVKSVEPKAKQESLFGEGLTIERL
jgi:hypothetical protein